MKTNKNISRRDFLRMSSLSAAGLVLASCAGPAAAPPPADSGGEKPAEKPAEAAAPAAKDVVLPPRNANACKEGGMGYNLIHCLV